jgi:hypothetical protein
MHKEMRSVFSPFAKGCLPGFRFKIHILNAAVKINIIIFNYRPNNFWSSDKFLMRGYIKIKENRESHDMIRMRVL